MLPARLREIANGQPLSQDLAREYLIAAADEIEKLNSGTDIGTTDTLPLATAIKALREGFNCRYKSLKKENRRLESRAAKRSYLDLAKFCRKYGL